jgi:hypothetical protein
MKSIANLASDTPTKKRRRGGDDDNFGADDNDWGIYRTIAKEDASDDEEEEDLDASLKDVESQLLKYDANFTEEQTREAEQDWTKSLYHAFARGPWPFDQESQREQNQLHLNVERIRVPEVVFQPSIAGLDQAGIVEIAAGILNERFADHASRPDLLKDIFLTGGNTMFQGFEQRLAIELRAVLEAGSPAKVRKAADPLLGAWKGAAQWAGSAASGKSFVTRAEFLEKGGEYIKVCIRPPVPNAPVLQANRRICLICWTSEDLTDIVAGARFGQCLLLKKRKRKAGRSVGDYGPDSRLFLVAMPNKQFCPCRISSTARSTENGPHMHMQSLSVPASRLLLRQMKYNNKSGAAAPSRSTGMASPPVSSSRNHDRLQLSKIYTADLRGVSRER